MGVFNNIQNALNTKLASIVGIPTVYYPNDNNEPTRGTNFVRPTLLPASSELYTINNENYHSGIYQVDIFTKLNKGTSEALLIADSIREAFNRQVLTSSGTRVFIQNINMSRAERDEAWWHVFLEINYICVA
jgi:hypothetical protein